ncbi:hypothetical protein L083_0101 [Actinoplanes sp. N902-109]|nr:hypothetical protein L083_0101 [Actinoplanes sp. N902-109]
MLLQDPGCCKSVATVEWTGLNDATGSPVRKSKLSQPDAT